jgi:hypothetical protein
VGLRRRGSDPGQRLYSAASAVANPLVGILAVAAALGAAVVSVPVQEVHCFVFLEHSRGLPAGAEPVRYSFFLSPDEVNIPPSLAYASGLCSRSGGGQASLFHHRNGCGHGVDRGRSVDGHGSVCGHESVSGDSAGESHLLAEDRIPLRAATGLSCSSGAGG